MSTSAMNKSRTGAGMTEMDLWSYLDLCFMQGQKIEALYDPLPSHVEQMACEVCCAGHVWLTHPFKVTIP